MSTTVILATIALVVVIGLVIKKKKDDDKDEAPVVTPTPDPVEPPVDNRERVIVDTDMSTSGDPDDVQCYIAQASSWRGLWNVRGIVSTTRSGSDVAFIERVISRMHNEVSATMYQLLSVFGGANATTFYRAEFSNTSTPLTIFVWGSALSLAKAVKGVPANQLANTTVYWVANWNRVSSPEFQQAWEELKPLVAKFKAFYRDEEGFRGIMRSGNTSKLEELQSYILNSPVGKVYKDYPIPAADATFHNKWKAGDLSLYFYHRNINFRDSLFVKDSYGGFVADGKSSENAVAADGFRNEMLRIVKQNVDRV